MPERHHCFGQRLPDDLALVSHSGALCPAILDWAASNGIGFPSVISIGAAADLDFGEILDYLAFDTATRGLLMYIEGINVARCSMSVLRAVARLEPVVQIEVRATRAGVECGATRYRRPGRVQCRVRCAGAAYRRGAGGNHSAVVRFGQGPGFPTAFGWYYLAMVTNGGGPDLMATDGAFDPGIKLTELAPQTLQRFNAALPPNGSYGDPVHIIGDAGADRYRATVEACLTDRGVDGVLVVLTPQAKTKPSKAAHQREQDVAWLIMESALAQGCHGLSELGEGPAVGLPPSKAHTLIASNPTKAMPMTQQLGFRVLRKINAPVISHKSDVAGVRLDLSSGRQCAACRRCSPRSRDVGPRRSSKGLSANPRRTLPMYARCWWGS